VLARVECSPAHTQSLEICLLQSPTREESLYPPLRIQGLEGLLFRRREQSAGNDVDWELPTNVFEIDPNFFGSGYREHRQSFRVGQIEAQRPTMGIDHARLAVSVLAQVQVSWVDLEISSQQVSKPAPTRNIPVTVDIATKSTRSIALFSREGLR
jgi:hypothetical protein